MAISKRFVITKDETNDDITYIEYKKVNGFSIKPKSTFNTDNMINVEKMVIISPSLIEKLIDKKCQRTLNKILKMTALIYDNDEDDDADGQLELLLNEIEKFKELILSKYKDYMKEKEYKLMIKKLDILQNEVKLRRLALRTKEEKKEVKKNKGR